jgi:C-terminal processing protease CtpA/Prc
VSADNDYLAYTQMEPLMPAYVWLEKGSVVGFDLSVRHRGEVRRVHVPALSRAQMQAAATAQPPSLALDWNRREAHVGDGGIAYLRPGPFYNNDEGAGDPYDTRAFKTFIDAAFEDFRRAGCRALLIDLRDNPGGDNSFSDLMVGWFADRRYRFASVFQIKTSRAAIDNNQKRLTSAVAIEASVSKQFAAAYAQHRPGEVFDFDIPLATPRRAERFRGKVFLLINRHTYSNAVSVAALAQDYHFATILGEETADLASTYGAMEQFTLSRTGIVVNFPKARIIRPNGNTAARGVVPDIAIRTPINEGRQDAVLAQALTIAAAKTGGKTASTSTHGEMRPGRWRLRMRTDVAGLPFSPPAVTSSHCLRAQQVKYGAANALQEQWSNCRYANRRRSGDRVSYELRCPRTDSAQGNYQFSSDGDHVHGTAVIGSGASRITLAWSGERLGSCAME